MTDENFGVRVLPAYFLRIGWYVNFYHEKD